MYQAGEEGVLQTRFGGVANAAIDANLENAYTDEASIFVERAVMNDLGIRVGYVWKKDKNGWQQVNTLRPLSAYNVPVTVIDPGPDGSAATTADNGTIAFLNLDDTSRGSSQLTTNIDGYEGTYKTFELSANKRYGQRWSMNASLSYTWTREFGNLYFNNRFGTAISNFSFFGSYPSTPNEHTENEFSNWSMKFSGTIDAGWGLRVTPVLKTQAGSPYGRYISVGACTATVTTNCSNYGTQLVLVEPIGARRQDNVVVVRLQGRKADHVCRAGEGRAVLRHVQHVQLRHGRQHQLAIRRVIREGHDRDRAADREVRGEVRLVASRAAAASAARTL